MDRSELAFLSAAELGGLIERREVSPVEVTEAYLRRIDDLDFKLNAFITVFRAGAMREAREAEEAIGRGEYRGPLHGVPVAIKDQFWTKGVRTTGGSRILEDFVPEEDATVVTRLREAGAVIVGKTNLTEFAITGFSHRYSTPRNPWDLDRYTGGSSGGSGAATAAFLCATSLGEDTGGSIRFPASWCGLAGIRPTWGRVSRYGVMRGLWSMDTVGPLSRSVEDAAITLGAIAGSDPKDGYTSKKPVADYRAGLSGGVQGMRIGLITDGLDDAGVDAEVRDAVLKAAEVMRELGAEVEEVSLPLVKDAAAVSSVLMAVETAANHSQWIRERAQDYGHDNRIALQAGSLVPAQAYYKAQRLRSMVREETLEALERYSVLLTPTTGTPAQVIKEDQPIGSKEEAGAQGYLLRRIWNLTSAPALSVPCGFSAKGLPMGLQIGGRPFDEATVLRVGHAYEQATRWNQRRPPHA